MPIEDLGCDALSFELFHLIQKDLNMPALARYVKIIVTGVAFAGESPVPEQVSTSVYTGSCPSKNRCRSRVIPSPFSMFRMALIEMFKSFVNPRVAIVWQKWLN